MDADDVVRTLELSPLGFEGGYYRESFCHDESLPNPGPDYDGPRSLSTAIYYLLTPDTCSLMHVLVGPEMYHFYLGDPVEQLLLHPDGTSEVLVLGPDLQAGQRVQHVVPGGVWQGSRLRSGGRFALMGTTMSPGFDLRDFRLGSRDGLLSRWPDRADLIAQLTPVRVMTDRFELAAGTRDLLHGHLRGADILEAGLDAPVHATWPPPGVDEAAIREDLEALERGAEQRGWWTWYVVRRSPRTVVGTAGFRGPPDASGEVSSVCRLVSSAYEPGAEAEILGALATYARDRDGVRSVKSQDPSR